MTAIYWAGSPDNLQICLRTPSPLPQLHSPFLSFSLSFTKLTVLVWFGLVFFVFDPFPSEPTMSLSFLGIFLRVLILEVSVYNVNITNQFQTAQGGVIKSVSRGDIE
jgi:hypothetical protein